MINRATRRRAAKQASIPWHRAQAERIFSEGAVRAEENIALHMTPAEAREALAKWAAIPGRTQAEVDAMNARGGNAASEMD